MISNIKIGTRLTLGFGLLLLCATALLALGLWRMNELHANAERIVNENTVNLTSAMEMREGGWSIALSLRKIVTPVNAQEGEQERARLPLLIDAYLKAEKTVKEYSRDSAAKAVLDASTAQNQMVMPIIEKIRTHVVNGNYFDASSLMQSEFLPVHEKWIASLITLAEYQKKETKATYEAAQQSYKNARTGMLAIGIVTIAIAAFVGWYITRTITLPLQSAAAIANTIACRDLTSAIQCGGEDEAGKLVNSLHTMQDNLLATLTNIKYGTETISVATREIAKGSSDLAARTEAQASALQQTAASMQELTRAVEHNAECALRANQLVASASDKALKGGQVVAQVIGTMGSIKESSRRITDITSVIDGIAFQTNILALNAAVEAARAGEQGRGFAVVAAEVRGLAQRSAGAAREIKELIGDAVGRVDAGSRLVDDAGQTMQEVVQSVQHVTDIMSEISSASQDQSEGIAEVNNAIRLMDNMTQQNAALVEQESAAAESMHHQVTLLTQSVAEFKLSEGGRNERVAVLVARGKAAAKPACAQTASNGSYLRIE